MKTYQSHKTVQAARITAIAQLPNSTSREFTLDDGTQVYPTGAQFEKAEVGGFFVRYDDKYTSYSPSKAFEEGYTEIGAPEAVAQSWRVEAAGKAVYSCFEGSHAHPWVDGGNSDKQYLARKYAKAALETVRTLLDPITLNTGLNFGLALEALKQGKCIAREGWNGKGQFVYFVPANAYPAQTGAAKAYFGDDGMVPYRAYMALKGADGAVSTWAPSGSDTLAEDWCVVDPAALRVPFSDRLVAGSMSSIVGQVHDSSALPSRPCSDNIDRAQEAALGQHQATEKAPAPAPGPKVTREDLEAAIVSEHYFTAQEGVFGAHPGFDPQQPALHPALGQLTFCVLVLKNGFTVTASEACVSAANFDPELGRKYAREAAIEKLWPLMGFGLADRLHQGRLLRKWAATGVAPSGLAPIGRVPADTSGLPG